MKTNKTNQGSRAFEYRRDGGCLLKYSPEHRGYVVVFRDDRLRTKAALIRAYENRAPEQETGNAEIS